MRSSIITNNIDYSYIDTEGYLIGGSCSVKIVLTEKLYSESTVSLKDTIKDLLNGKLGFDHKIWIFDDSLLLSDIVVNQLTDSEERLSFTTPVITAMTDMQSIRRIKGVHSSLSVSTAISKFLASSILDKSLKIETIIECDSKALHNNSGIMRFRYCHGSEGSDFGSQNIAHGHLSYLQVLDKNYKEIKVYSPELSAYLLEMVIKLDNTYFINSYNNNNDLNLDADKYSISYISKDRGFFNLVLNIGDPKVKVCVLNTDTSIEHIINFIVFLYGRKLKKFGACYFVLSEGLERASIVKL